MNERKSFPEIRHILPVKKAFLRIIESVRKIFQKNAENIAYYAVVAVILCALSVAAHNFRNSGSDKISVTPKEDAENSQSVMQQPLFVFPEERENEESEETIWLAPADGELIGMFVGSSLVWSETLQQWQTHEAVDYAAVQGEIIRAATDGTVIEAYCDPLYGNVVVIDHGDNVLLRYCSLNSLNMVQIGDELHAGDAIGAAGECLAEAELGVHLHLECEINGEPIDYSTLIQDSDADDLRE